MDAASVKYDLDLSKMGDEELVVLAKECGYQPAANELIVRHREGMSRLIAYRARRTGLSAADVEDAQQNAVFALLEAVATYDVGEMVKPKGCRFRTFLRLVVTARFRDFVKHLSRVESHYDRGAAVQKAPDAGRGPGGARPLCEAWGNGTRGDPAAAAEWQEALARLHQAVEQLEPRSRRLWDGLVSGKRLRTLARDLRVSYDTAKRRRSRLLTELTTQLRGLQL
jgi:RNA polymerase sigma factor (sigma-70 family)